MRGTNAVASSPRSTQSECFPRSAPSCQRDTGRRPTVLPVMNRKTSAKKTRIRTQSSLNLARRAAVVNEPAAKYEVAPNQLWAGKPRAELMISPTRVADSGVVNRKILDCERILDKVFVHQDWGLYPGCSTPNGRNATSYLVRTTRRQRNPLGNDALNSGQWYGREGAARVQSRAFQASQCRLR